jgi:zinc transport system permease protein
MFYGGIAGGVVLIGLSPEGSAANLTAYLFGAITTTTAGDLAVFGVLSALVLAVAVGLAPQLFAVSNDEEYARASGMNVLGLNVLLAVLTAATVVISMRIVGLLLISALMIVPNAVAQVSATSFRSSVVVAVAVGVGVSVLGTTASWYVDTPPGGTIVLLAIAVFLGTAATARLRQAAHARRHHSEYEHRHEHGRECGHQAVPHGDHVDYVHDGHRHAAHGASYDDH